MDDGETAPPAAKRRNKKKSTYIPHELVREILARLPVVSLVRFSCMCEAWCSTISLDASFHRMHLRLQKPLLLVSPQTLRDDRVHTDKIILYGWEDNQQGPSMPLLHATATDLCSNVPMHDFAHCDGLVLFATSKAGVREVLYAALCGAETRRLL
ncbi:hypothetical protein ACQ4PT_039713 [Festuca glaucescens]